MKQCRFSSECVISEQAQYEVFVTSLDDSLEFLIIVKWKADTFNFPSQQKYGVHVSYSVIFKNIITSGLNWRFFLLKRLFFEDGGESYEHVYPLSWWNTFSSASAALWAAAAEVTFWRWKIRTWYLVYCDCIDFVLVFLCSLSFSLFSLSWWSWLDLFFLSLLSATLSFFFPQCFLSFTASLSLFLSLSLTGDGFSLKWGFLKESVAPWQQLSCNQVDCSLLFFSLGSEGASVGETC